MTKNKNILLKTVTLLSFFSFSFLNLIAPVPADASVGFGRIRMTVQDISESESGFTILSLCSPKLAVNPIVAAVVGDENEHYRSRDLAPGKYKYQVIDVTMPFAFLYENINLDNFLEKNCNDFENETGYPIIDSGELEIKAEYYTYVNVKGNFDTDYYIGQNKIPYNIVATKTSQTQTENTERTGLSIKLTGDVISEDYPYLSSACLDGVLYETGQPEEEEENENFDYNIIDVSAGTYDLTYSRYGQCGETSLELINEPEVTINDGFITEFVFDVDATFNKTFAYENLTTSLEYKPFNLNCFKDIDKLNHFAIFICALKDDEVISGYPDGYYRPENNVDRGQMAKFIKNGFNVPEDTTCGDFKDVPSSHPFYTEITSLKCAKIINGFPDGTYRPESNVNRGQMAKFIFKASGMMENLECEYPQFPDTNGEFKDMIRTLRCNKIISGYPDGTYKPDATVNRGAMAKFVDNARWYWINF